MKKFTLKSVVTLVLGVVALGGVAHAEDKVVNVFNWAEYTAPDTLPGFERATGIKVSYDTYDSNDLVQSKLLSGKSGYDVVVPSSHYAARQIKAGLFQKLDKANMPNLKHLDPEIMAVLSQVDPGNEYLVPWGYGTNGLGYNVTKAREILGADADLANWDNLFNPEIAQKFKSCGISILDEPAQVLPAVLHYIGKDPNSSQPQDIKAAFAVLKKIRPYIRQFSSAGYIDELASGDLCLVFGFNGDVMIAADRAKEAKRPYEIQYFIPKGGAPVWFDTMAVPKDAPHPKNAMTFINYMETPQVHAAITNEMFYPNANATARQYIRDDIANNKQLYPDADVAKTLYVIKPQPINIVRLETRLWAEFKTSK